MKSWVTLALVSLLFVTSVIAQSTTLTFNAALTGANVIGAAGSPAGFGTATLTIDGDQATLDVTTLGLTDITNISLYQAAAGANGPLIVSFTDTNNYAINGRFHRTMTLDPGVAAGIAANPQNVSLVIASSSFPDGAIRGQLNNANVTYLAGTISGTSPICAGGTGIPGATGSFVFAVTTDPGGLTDTVRYDILTNGLGGTINALQIGDALSGPGLFTVGGNLTSTNGRFTGATTITSARGRLLQTVPAGARFTITTPVKGLSCAAAGAIQFAHELFIPVVGTVKGAGNTNYMTDVNIFNNSATGTNADVFLQYFPTGNSTPTAQTLTATNLAARSITNYRDLSTNVLNGITGIGALRVISPGSIFANARIYNNLSATGGGTFGQFIPALPRTFALNEGTLLGLSNIVSGSNLSAGSGNARTNIGLFNPSENATTVTLELRDANGLLLGQRQLTLGPWLQLQMPLSGANGLFNTVNGDVPTSSVYFLSGAPLFVYASVVDNPTGDASYVAPSASGSGASGAGQ